MTSNTLDAYAPSGLEWSGRQGRRRQHASLQTQAVWDTSGLGFEPSEPTRVPHIRIEAWQHDADLWLTPVLEQLGQLLSLPSNWDGYGSKEIAPEAAVRTLWVLGVLLCKGLPMPTFVPTPIGGLQLEWHEGGCDVEVEVGPDESVYAHVQFSPGHAEFEGDVVTHEQLLQLRALLCSKLVG